MKTWKQRLAALLSCTMLLGVFSTLAMQNVQAAGETFSVTADKKNLKRGDTVTYSVDLTGNTVGCGLDLEFIYDKDSLELQGNASKGDTFEGAMMSDLNDTTAGSIHAVIASLNVLPSGNIFKATFKVTNTAKGDIDVDVAKVDLTNSSNQLITDYTLSTSNASAYVSVPATAVALNKTSMTLARGTGETLTVTATPHDTTDAITWSSSKPSVATVDASGKVEAIAVGTTVITAKVGTKTATCNVTVNAPLTSIEIAGDTNTLKKGTTTQLSVVYNPVDTTDNKTVSWTSSAPTVATVSNSGLVTALKDGSTTITATVGGKSDTYEITVQEVNLTSISIKETLTIHKGDTSTLSVTYTPDNTTDDKTVSWKSSDSSIVKVDANGKLTALKPGSAIITAEVGNLSDTCTVTVDAPLKKITPTKTSLELVKKQTETIQYSFDPADTTDSKVVSFVSNDTSVATVDAAGVVTAKKAGTTKIVLTGANDVKAEVSVKVTEIPINKIVLSAVNKIVEPGDIVDLEATIQPINNTDDDQTITWSSSDTSVATVASTVNGEAKVTAVAGGTAVITAKAWNGTQATCTIKVPKHITSITLPTTASLLRGETKILDVTINPADTDDDKTVTWTSSNPAVATVDAATGMITAKKSGTTQITATTLVKDRTTEQPFTATTVVTINENNMTPSLAEDLTIDNEEPYVKGQPINANDIMNLKDIIDAEKLTDDFQIVWTSSDETIATVDQSGMITFIKAGVFTLTAEITATDGSGVSNTTPYVVNAELAVKEIPLESISFDKDITKILVGNTEVLKVVYKPADTSDDKTVIWTSSDPSVLTVEDGILTAKKAGKVTVTAKVGEKCVNCEITVKEAEKEAIKDNTSPETGDSTNIGLWISILVAAVITFLYAIYKKIYKVHH